MKKKLTLIVGGIALLMSASCSSEFDPCVCYEDALSTDDRSTLEQKCQDLVRHLDEDALKEASNECFANDVKDILGGGVL